LECMSAVRVVISMISLMVSFLKGFNTLLYGLLSIVVLSCLERGRKISENSWNLSFYCSLA
jgi:hypothetical protein